MELEKIDLCQYRANCNLLNKKIEKEVKNKVTQSVHELKKLQKVASQPLLVKPSKEISDEDRIFVTNTEFKSNYPALQSQELENISKPLLPPGINEETLKSVAYSKKKRLLSPSMSEEMYAEILSNNVSSLESTKKPASLARSMSMTMHSNKQKYEDLLAKCHGYIPPRKK